MFEEFEEYIAEREAAHGETVAARTQRIAARGNIGNIDGLNRRSPSQQGSNRNIIADVDVDHFYTGGVSNKEMIRHYSSEIRDHIEKLRNLTQRTKSIHLSSFSDLHKLMGHSPLYVYFPEKKAVGGNYTLEQTIISKYIRKLLVKARGDYVSLIKNRIPFDALIRDVVNSSRGSDLNHLDNLSIRISRYGELVEEARISNIKVRSTADAIVGALAGPDPFPHLVSFFEREKITF